jgi:hypothetical protein
MNPNQIEELRRYPENHWGQCSSGRWTAWCNSLEHYEAPTRGFSLDRERKWELTSAFQKSIRRGDKQMALRLISAMDGMPKERGYFWKRLCVIACEDIGPADDTLASFVVACATVFPPKKTGSQNYDLFCFLAEQMCDLSTRSRIYCSYGIIEPAAMKGELPALTAEEKQIVEAIVQRKAVIQAATNRRQQWQATNDWRAEGMLRFVGLRLPLEMTRVQTPVPPFKMLFDLPAFCYDTHTRVGLKMLHRLVQGVGGAESIKKFFQQNNVKSPHRVLGETLFFTEGGRIKGELIYGPLAGLEQRYFAHKNGLPLNKWFDSCALVEEALAKGTIDRVREEVLQRVYGQMLLGLV